MLTKEEKSARQKRYDAKRGPRKRVYRSRRLIFTEEQQAERQKVHDAKLNETRKRKLEKAREYAKKRRADNPELKVMAQEQRQIHWEQSIVSNSQSSDKKAKRTYDEKDYITIDFLRDLLQKQNGLCAYCKDPMKYGKGINRNTNPSGLSIQRILTYIAHTQNNCVFTCMLCNTMEIHIPHEIMLLYGKELRLKTMLYCSSIVHVGNNPVPAADWYKNGEYGAHCKICIKKTRKSRAKS